MKKIISHNKPTIGKEEKIAINRVIESGWIAQGAEAGKFEDELSKYLGGKPGQAAAFASGTAALYVALVSLGIGNKSEVIIPTYVCSAVLNAIFLAGAMPILADINEDDLNISFVEAKKKVNPRTRAIIIPHIYGMPADIDKFKNLKVPIIEDCAQAIGAKFNGKYAGTFGKAAIFSFYASKTITTGQGGMVFSKDKNLIKRIKDYREFDCRKKYKPRFNFQMTDMQAAMGRAQLKKLNLFLKKRKKIANEYYKILPPGKSWPPKEVKNKNSNFFRFLIRCENPQNLKSHLEKRSIKTIVPIKTRELLHRYLRQKSNNFPVSEKIAKKTLSLPIYPSLDTLEIKKIKNSLREYFDLK